MLRARSSHFRRCLNSNSFRHASTLAELSKDLCEQAANNELDPVFGRENEIKRAMRILSRRRKSNLCLIGEPGVGKTCIVEGLAQQIARGNVPENLRNKRVLSLDVARLVAGTKFRGEFEGKMADLIEEAEGSDVILFIDEIHMIVGAGSAGGGQSGGGGGMIDAANMLKPALARGSVQCIGATTMSEYRTHIESDAALVRRMQTLQVREPSPVEAVRILCGLRPSYESHHGVVMGDDALLACVELSSRYVKARKLPDSAIDLMDEGCAETRMRFGGWEDTGSSRAAGGGGSEHRGTAHAVSGSSSDEDEVRARQVQHHAEQRQWEQEHTRLMAEVGKLTRELSRVRDDLEFEHALEEHGEGMEAREREVKRLYGERGYGERGYRRAKERFYDDLLWKKRTREADAKAKLELAESASEQSKRGEAAEKGGVERAAAAQAGAGEAETEAGATPSAVLALEENMLTNPCWQQELIDAASASEVANRRRRETADNDVHHPELGDGGAGAGAGAGEGGFTSLRAQDGRVRGSREIMSMIRKAGGSRKAHQRRMLESHIASLEIRLRARTRQLKEHEEAAEGTEWRQVLMERGEVGEGRQGSSLARAEMSYFSVMRKAAETQRVGKRRSNSGQQRKPPQMDKFGHATNAATRDSDWGGGREDQEWEQPQKDQEQGEQGEQSLQLFGERRFWPRVTSELVMELLAESTGVPMHQLMGQTEKRRMLDLGHRLGERVVGQQRAIAALAEVMQIRSAGLQTAGNQRPIGAFLFLGPTGVGKTELAKALAAQMFGGEHANDSSTGNGSSGSDDNSSSGLPLLHLDMSEYSEQHSVAKLIGAPPGYVGHERAGNLTEPVRRRPHQVVLLDEFEKAHPHVGQLLLQLCDEGRLTDAQGPVDFSQTVVILTSNIGGEILASHALEQEQRQEQEQGRLIESLDRAEEAGAGAGAEVKVEVEAEVGAEGARVGAELEVEQKVQQEVEQEVEQRVRELVTAALPAELLNRMDDVVMFKSLGRSEMRRLVDAQLREVDGMLRQRQQGLGMALSSAAALEPEFHQREEEQSRHGSSPNSSRGPAMGLEVSEGARMWLEEQGHSPTHGARPLRRCIHKHVLLPLAKLLLEHEYEQDQQVQGQQQEQEREWQERRTSRPTAVVVKLRQEHGTNPSHSETEKIASNGELDVILKWHVHRPASA